MKGSCMVPVIVYRATNGVALSNQIVDEHLSIWEHLPKGVIELVHALQPRFNTLISVQDYVVRIQLKVLVPPLRI
jgi:hypothetical protein